MPQPKIIISTLLKALSEDRALTSEEYVQLHDLSEVELNEVIYSLYDDETSEYNFFDLRVINQAEVDFIWMDDDDREAEICDFPILFYALRLSNLDFVIRLLSILYSPEYNDMETVANSTDDLGQTALHLAACLSQARICQLLIQLGADVSALNNNGNSPLTEILFEVFEDHPQNPEALETRNLLLEQEAQYITNHNMIDVGGLELPDIKSEYYMRNASIVDELLADRANISYHALFSLNLISEPIYKTLSSQAFNNESTASTLIEDDDIASQASTYSSVVEDWE